MKTLILTFDATGMADWHARAVCRQMADWFKTNKAVFNNEHLVILPGTGETRLYWLEGEVSNPDDIKSLQEIKDRIKPVLEVALDIKIDKENRYKVPTRERFKNATKTLNNLRIRS
jgi:hypothetical protein